MAIQLNFFYDVTLVPWGGASPRSLTKARKALFLRREPQKDARQREHPDQIDMFRRRQRKAPLVLRGAPLLFEREGK